MPTMCRKCLHFRRIKMPGGFRGACAHVLRDPNSILSKGSSHCLIIHCDDFEEGECINIETPFDEDVKSLQEAEEKWGAKSIYYRDFVLVTVEVHKEFADARG